MKERERERAEIHISAREDVESEGELRPQPDGMVGMVLISITRVWMNQNGVLSTVDREPAQYFAELRWCHEMRFEHGLRVWTDGSIHHGVDGHIRK